MAQQHGRNSVLELFNSAGASQNVSGDLTNVALSFTRDNADVTTFGDDTVQRISGLRDYTLTCTGIWNSGTASTVIDTLDDLMSGSIITLFRWFPGGKISGCQFWTGCALVSAYDETAPVNGPVGLSFAMQSAAGSLSASTV